MTRSIRTRIVVWFVALTASLLALFAGILALWLHEARRAALDAALRERAHALLGQMDVEYGGLEIDREGGAPLPSEGEGRWFAVLTFPTLWRVGESRPAGPLSAERVGAIAAALGSGSSELYLTLPGARAGTRVYAALLPVPPDEDADQDHEGEGPARGAGRAPIAQRVVIVVGEPLAGLRAEVYRQVGSTILLVPLAVLLAVGAGVFLARRIAQPLAAIADTAAGIEAGDRSLRIPRTGVGDEVDRLAERLDRAFQALGDAIDQQTRFTADASHELRTPLSVVIAQAEVALRRPRDAEGYRAALTQVLRAGRRMQETLEALLVLARADAGLLRPREEPVPLAPLVSEAWEPLAEEAAAGAIRLEVEASEEVVACGDRRQLRILVQNLLANAVRYSDGPARVRVEMTAVEGPPASARLVVADEGCGIPPDVLPHIFDRFYRADAARSGNAGGSGLGLSLVRTIAEAAGGSVSARSAVGEGTTVTVDLPRPTPAGREAGP